MRRRALLALLLPLAACGGGDEAGSPTRRSTEMPVALNTESPFQYPPDLYDQGVEGEVRLRLFVDAQGQVVADSTSVASSSGTPGLDSAAVHGSGALRFAPAQRNGIAVGMAFYQPVIFRRDAAQQGNPSP
jgi:TonB family protein